ncbi:15461_t:CDS:2, partial [Cetraspora pellucida]
VGDLADKLKTAFEDSIVDWEEYQEMYYNAAMSFFLKRDNDKLVHYSQYLQSSHSVIQAHARFKILNIL